MKKCLAFLLLAAGARAHPGLLDMMWVQFEPDRVHVAVSVSLREIGVAQGESLDENNLKGMEASVAQHASYVLGHLTLTTEAGKLSGRVIGVTAPPAYHDPEGTFYQYDLEYPLGGLRPQEVTFFQDMLKEWNYAVATAWSVSYVAKVKRLGSAAIGVELLANQKPARWSTGLVSSMGPAPPLAAQRNPGSGVLWDDFRHGFSRILTGGDHLLFVAALVIAAVRFWEMAIAIGAFTCAQTLALALSVFGLLRVPAFVTEPVLLLSIVVIALGGVFGPERSRNSVLLASAFGFGLTHGLGLAGELWSATAGRPVVGTWAALAAFGLGGIAGQQLLVLPLYAALAKSRHALPVQAFSTVRHLGAAAISCGAACCFLVTVQTQFHPSL